MKSFSKERKCLVSRRHLVIREKWWLLREPNLLFLQTVQVAMLQMEKKPSFSFLVEEKREVDGFTL